MKDKFTREWIISNAREIVEGYDPGVLTIRGLHYRLVSIGMTNSTNHYKRVVAAMGVARREGLIDYETFSDNDRGMIGSTDSEDVFVEREILTAKEQVHAWMNNFSRNRWERQYYYPEVFIEKKALQGVFKPVCRELNVALGACKGYPSLTFLHEAAERFNNALNLGQEPLILYFGDYDPSGEDIPRCIKDSLLGDFDVDVEVRRIALVEDQVRDWGLPPAPTKLGDSRSANWDGVGQVELDAVDPKDLQDLCREAIDEAFDFDTYEDLLEDEAADREVYRSELKEYVGSL